MKWKYKQKYSIIKELGKGAWGTTYEIKINTERYAMKIQKVLKPEIEEFIKARKITNNMTKYAIWREISTSLALKEYDNHFLKIKEFRVVKECTFKQHRNRAIDKYGLADRYEELAKSKYCIEIITDLKEGSLVTIYESLSKNQIISMIIQITYAIYLMHQKKIWHGDIHSQNICYNKTDKKFIKVFNENVPTYGYIYSLIDYGSSGKLDDNSDKKIKDLFNEISDIGYKNEYIRLLVVNSYVGVLKKNPDWLLDSCRKYNIKEYNTEIESYPEFDMIKEIFKYLFREIDTIKPNTIISSAMISKIMMEIFYADKICKNYFKFNSQLKYGLDTVESIYYINCIWDNNPKKIIKYLNDKIKL
jgi:serine/threonine protein kinase